MTLVGTLCLFVCFKWSSKRNLLTTHFGMVICTHYSRLTQSHYLWILQFCCLICKSRKFTFYSSCTISWFYLIMTNPGKIQNFTRFVKIKTNHIKMKQFYSMQILCRVGWFKSPWFKGALDNFSLSSPDFFFPKKLIFLYNWKCIPM